MITEETEAVGQELGRCMGFLFSMFSLYLAKDHLKPNVQEKITLC